MKSSHRETFNKTSENFNSRMLKQGANNIAFARTFTEIYMVGIFKLPRGLSKENRNRVSIWKRKHCKNKTATDANWLQVFEGITNIERE